MVRPFSLAPGYHTKELIYRTGEFQYESDYYNQFVTDVGQQTAEQTRKWLSQSGYFSHVVPPGSTMNATHILEGNITHLYGDFRDKSNAKAFVSITFYLLDITNKQTQVLLSESIDAQASITEATAENLIKAYQHCLQQILENFEKKLAQINLTTSM
ncbi:MAG: membrane integrity-associated transporter subunit PqiC [Sedimentisphaerales bacterium]|nr:membrane integrity-associated transporter subunit PqiC [Sedimentisphaerales bacterium]